MFGQIYQISPREREVQAKLLGLSLIEFERLLLMANNAYAIMTNLGPFYGKEEIKEPTFRMTAEPVKLSKASKEALMQFGEDLLRLGKVLPELPEEAKKKLGEGLVYNVPPTWRVDAILSEDSTIKINEVEGLDGANALMMAEQFAYNLQTPDNSTAAILGKTLLEMCKPANLPLKIALIRTNVAENQTTPNAKRFISYMEKLSGGKIHIDHFDETEVHTGVIKPDWSTYHGVLNETSLILSPKTLFSLGVSEEQLITAGNYNSIMNKGLFALIFDESLNDFWEKNLGAERLNRFKNILIPSRFVETEEEVEQARQEGKVVKVSWAGSNTLLINRSRGVAMPEGFGEHSSDERWAMLKEIVKEGARVIAQDYVRPAKISAFLRKKSTTLEPVEWHNRVCVKYVVEGDPKGQTVPSVALTATEVTLGPDVIPAGRKCAFTAGSFE